MQDTQVPLRVRAPMRGLLATLVVCALVAPSAAQPKKPEKASAPLQKPPEKGEKKEKEKVKNFDFNALDLNGRMRTPQLLYFLERANEELERASLEKRSFIPHMVRSVEEEQL
jgi:hypothetical protein